MHGGRWRIDWQRTNRGGYLATITSAEENMLLFQLIKTRPELWVRHTTGNSLGPWIGGVQPAGSPEPDGGWTWVTGEPFGPYTHWYPGQPDNDSNVWSNGENVLEFDAKLGNWWNDSCAITKKERLPL